MLKFISTVDKSFDDFLVFNLKTQGNPVDNVDDLSLFVVLSGKKMIEHVLATISYAA